MRSAGRRSRILPGYGKMVEHTPAARTSTAAGHLSVQVEGMHAPTPTFSFERPQSRVGVTASVVTHLVFGAIAVFIATYAPAPSVAPPAQTRLPESIVWLAEPGPGGGGGGGGGSGMAALGGVGPAACIGADPQAALALFNSTAVTDRAMSHWHNASDVQIFPVKLCGPQRNQLAATISASPKLGVMQTSVMTAPAVTTALNRAGFSARNVFAVANNFGRLTVYVY